MPPRHNDGTIAVTATVAKNCTVTNGTLDFGAYDPIVANATVPKNDTAPASISVSCTKGTSATVTLATTTPLTNGTDTLAFALFSDAGHSVAFAAPVLSFAAGKAAQAVSVYGQIAAGQDVSTGSYNGVVTATITY